MRNPKCREPGQIDDARFRVRSHRVAFMSGESSTDGSTPTASLPSWRDIAKREAIFEFGDRVRAAIILTRI